jgi:hypothetical protein
MSVGVGIGPRGLELGLGVFGLAVYCVVVVVVVVVDDGASGRERAGITITGAGGPSAWAVASVGGGASETEMEESRPFSSVTVLGAF